MKIKNLLFLFPCFAFLSCSKNNSDAEKISYKWPQMVEQLTQRTFDNSKAMEELSRERTENKIPFTMNFEGCEGKPVILMEEEHQIFMHLDSGCTRNWFFNSLLEKGNISQDYYFDTVVKEIRNNQSDISAAHPDDTELIQYLKKQWDNYNLNYLAQVWINDIPLRYDSLAKQKYDGVLGAEFLLHYKRVTIDYINNYIILDDEKLDGYSIPYTLTPNDEFLINFYYQGQQELAMIDTGNYCFTPRHNIGDRKQDYDMNDYSTYGIGYKGKIPVTPRVMHTYNDIMIGDVSYNNLKGAYSTIRGSGFRKGSQAHMMKLNNFGNVVFYDHIIQFDLVNKQFIIK